jgi:hypothetical protein
MQEMVIRVPDTKLSFFTALMRELGIHISEEKEDYLHLSESDKTLVRDRIKRSTADPARILDWELVHTTLADNA